MPMIWRGGSSAASGITVPPTCTRSFNGSRAVGPVLVGHRLVDDDDGRCAAIVARVEPRPRSNGIRAFRNSRQRLGTATAAPVNGPAFWRPTMSNGRTDRPERQPDEDAAASTPGIARIRSSARSLRATTFAGERIGRSDDRAHRQTRLSTAIPRSTAPIASEVRISRARADHEHDGERDLDRTNSDCACVWRRPPAARLVASFMTLSNRRARSRAPARARTRAPPRSTRAARRSATRQSRPSNAGSPSRGSRTSRSRAASACRRRRP